MTSEWKDKQAGNGLKQYSKIDAATFPRSNTRKGSFASAICDKVARTPQCQSKWPPTSCSKNAYAGRGSYYKKPSFQDDSSESDYQRVEKGSLESTSSATKIQAKDETYSTSSSFGGGKPNNFKSELLIDNFKVVVMGDEFDGIKTKGQPNNRFAAACLFKPPEANELTMPDF